MEEDKYIYIQYYSAIIKIKANELIEAVKKDENYEARINELKAKIYENINIHPAFQNLEDGDYYVLYNIEYGETITLIENCKIWCETEYGFIFSIDSKQSDTIYELKKK